MRGPYYSSPPVPPTGNTLAGYLRDLTQWAAREFNRRTPERQPVPELYLNSPDQSVWRVEVSDSGVITATKVSTS